MFRLSLVGRNLPALEATRARCVELGCCRDNVLVIQCDLRSELECQQAVRKTTQYYGGLKHFLFIEMDGLDGLNVMSKGITVL